MPDHSTVVGVPGRARSHYEAANKLVEETGYHRRDPELEALSKALQ